MDIRSTVDTHLQVLSVQIGTRPIGTEGHKRAEEHIYQSFGEYGYETNKLSFPCQAWINNYAKLQLNDKEFPCLANTFSKSCNVSTSYVMARDLKELEQIEADGKIIVLSGNLTEDFIFPYGFSIFNLENHKRLNELLMEKSPPAVITICSRGGRASPIIEDWDLGIPSVSVTQEIGSRIVSRNDNIINLNMSTSFVESSASNVIARKVGKSKKVLLCAHSDTKYGTPGAIDNGCGVAVLLALAKKISDKSFPFTVEFVTFAGEETYALGEIKYFEEYEEELKDLLLVINVDGVGLAASFPSVVTFGTDQRIESIVDESMKTCSTFRRVEPWYAGDHTMFVYRNIPCIAISSQVFGQNIATITHCELDTYDIVSIDHLEETINFIENILIGIPEKNPIYLKYY